MESSRVSGPWHGFSGSCLGRRCFSMTLGFKHRYVLWLRAGVWFPCNGDVGRFIGRGSEGPSGPWFPAVGHSRWGYYLTLLRWVFD